MPPPKIMHNFGNTFPNCGVVKKWNEIHYDFVTVPDQGVIQVPIYCS